MSTVTTISGTKAIYLSPDFRRRAAEALAVQTSDVAGCIDALLQADRIPMAGPLIPVDIAVWADAAHMIAVIVGRQVEPDAVVRAADRICAMRIRSDFGRRAPGAFPGTRHAFGPELASCFRHLLPAAKADTARHLFPSVALSWSAGGTALYGTIDLSRAGGETLSYAAISPSLPAVDSAEPVPPDAGTATFPAASLADFGRIMGDGMRHGRAAGPATEGSAR